MKMRRQFLNLLLTICLVSGAVPAVVFAKESSDNTKAIQLGTSQIEGGQADSIYFGTYQQSSDGSGGYSKEPVKWQVLSNEEDKLLLFADTILDIKDYNDERDETPGRNIYWSECSLREWLNGDFVDAAFSENEKMAIPQTEIATSKFDLPNGSNQEVESTGNEETADQVFLLSVNDVKNEAYFPGEWTEDQFGSGKESFLPSHTTDYVKGITGSEGNHYWLRDPGKSYERSIYNANIFVAIVVIIGMMAMYVFMYAALFDAVRISAESAKVQADLRVASDIQQSVLPSVFPAFPDRSEFDIYASMRPAREVGGDFYDFYLIDEDHLAFVIADVSGKGVAAALFMMAGRTTIRNQSTAGAQPGNILSNSNEQLLENNEKGLFITVFFAILNLRTGELKFSNAGHNAPYICRKDGTVEMLKMRHGFVLGGMEGIRYRTEENVLHPGDKILLYTDGVTEAVNMELQLYGDERLKTELERVQSQGIKEIIQDVTHSIDEFAAGAMQADDITMLIVEYKGEKQKDGGEF